MKQEKGFTLAELMIVVVIVAILLSIALPSYTSYVTRGKIVEATSNLAALRVKMEQYYQDTRSYLNGAACGTIGATPTATVNFTYDCVAGANTYTITATGNPSGSMSGFVYKIDQSNAKTSPFTATAIAKGWTAHNPDNCWVTKQGGAC